jgi:sn-glycerol 3-phosphate transport system substrate-binding protein
VRDAAQAVTEIQWWHAHDRRQQRPVNTLAKRFNESQSDYKVTAVYKGSYPEAMAAAIAAFRAATPRTSCRSSRSAPAP